VHLILFSGPDDGALDCPDCELPTIALDDSIELGARFLCLACCTIYVVTDIGDLRRHRHRRRPDRRRRTGRVVTPAHRSSAVTAAGGLLPSSGPAQRSRVAAGR
jgi:hypothetical protein